MVQILNLFLWIFNGGPTRGRRYFVGSKDGKTQDLEVKIFYQKSIKKVLTSGELGAILAKHFESAPLPAASNKKVDRIGQKMLDKRRAASYNKQATPFKGGNKTMYLEN